MRVLKFLLPLLFSMLFVGFASADKKKKANKDTDKWRYDIECAGTGQDGTFLVKVWSYSKKASVAAEQSRKNAVHGVIFKGIAGKSGCPSQRPLTKNVNLINEQSDYFEKFFSDNGGDYMKYVLNAGNVQQESVKIGKEYKVGVVISVAKDQLRKDLEKAGIIKGLSSGF